MESKQNNTSNEDDIQSIINSLTSPEPEEHMNQEPGQTEEQIKETFGHGGRLWNDFLECLELSKENSGGSRKLYPIDDDIVATLHQCDFGAGNVYVINSILRTFLMDNIDNLRSLPQQKVESLLDKYDKR